MVITGEVCMSIQAISSVSASDAFKNSLVVSSQVPSNSNVGGKKPAGKMGGGGAPKAKATTSSSSSSSSSSDTKVYDKMDTNKDGTVSSQEKAAYLLVNPEEAIKDTESINYIGKSNQPEDQGILGAIINLSA
jgi:hypothetical protein